MTAKQYLRRVRSARHRIEILEWEKVDAMTRATSATAPPDAEPVQTSAVTRRLEAYAQQVEEIEQQITYWTELEAEAVRLIHEIPDPVLQDVLELYYIRRLTWAEVAKELSYSYKHVVHVLHSKALIDFGKRWNPM